MLGAVHTGDIISAKGDLAKLETFYQQLLDNNENYKANQVLIQVKTSQAWINYSQGDIDGAIVQMRNAADMEDRTGKHPKTPCEVIPARELLADMLLDANKPLAALKAYELDLKGHPNRFNGIYGAARAAKAYSDVEKAAMYFDMLLTLTKESDSDRPEVTEARTFLKQNQS